MIPCSLTLENFLSFGAEQTLTFEPDRVFLLRGDNGVGKSSIFDAILFALFNGHRAGQKDLYELIHKGKDCGKVVFDFQLSDRRYRAQRSVQRKVDGRTKQVKGQTDAQLFEQTEQGAWKPITGTHKQEEFKKWIDQNLGLRFETFTAAVLLMQNRAEQLVSNDADSAKQRFEVLSRVVGLDRVRRLHTEAEARRKQAVTEAESRLRERDRIAEVTDSDLAQAVANVEAAGEQIGAADTEITRLTKTRDRAADWERLRQNLAERTVALSDAERLVGDSVAIERDGRRVEELTECLPEAETYLTRCEECLSAKAQIAELNKVIERSEAETARLEAEITGHEEQREALAVQETDLLAALQRIETDKCTLEGVVKLLQRLDRERGHYTKHRTAEMDAQSRLLECKVCVQTRANELSAARLAEGEAADESKRKFVALTTSRERMYLIREQLERFNSVAGDQNCRFCGLRLSPEHKAAEQTRLQAEVADRERERAEAEAQHCAGEVASAKATAHCREADESHRRATDAHRDVLHEIILAVQAMERHQTSCEDARRDLPEPYRSRVSPATPDDWATVSYPSASDWGEITNQQEADLTRHRQMKATLLETRTAHSRVVKSLTTCRNHASVLAASLAQAKREVAEQLGQLKMATALRDNALQRLPAPWAEAVRNASRMELGNLQRERDELVGHEAAGRWARLQRAQASLTVLRDECARLQSEADAFENADRRSLADVTRELTQAADRRTNLERVRAEADAALTILTARKSQREEANNLSLQADRYRHLWTKLADLLGRKRLQRHLLRRAEQGVLEQANRLLDRLTGGVLSLQLQGGEEGDDDRALQLEATKRNTGQTFALSFLSGSERFRLAVALALAIGQYGCRRQRPIESVIIDEGFGCLDRTNRQAMIEELGALREQLRCVVLVSHQEDFAEAFPDGYRFALKNGATIVEACTGYMA
ncbi:AAA family ATPase [Zavarzinella formosa]|uniref:AAA family ATPase n=1 Tax=Zavarzinella formosa TaxID=360055 RepID=UPI0002FE6E5D|nr:SMC family ATPase [Zavarzinella formosa]